MRIFQLPKMTVTVSMASRYSNVMFLRFKNAAERRKAEDEQYKAAFFTPDRFYLATTASGEPHNLPKVLHGQLLHEGYWGKPALFGRTESPTDDLYGLLLRRNLLLHDKHSRLPILQRLNPRTHELDNSVTKDIEKGRQRFEAVRKRCKAHYKRSVDHATPGQERGDPFHFGVWYEAGSQCPVPTLDTLQDGNSEASKSVLRFMVWLRSYVDTYVQSFIDESNLEPTNRVEDDESGPAYITLKFKESMNRRPADFEWLAGKGGFDPRPLPSTLQCLHSFL